MSLRIPTFYIVAELNGPRFVKENDTYVRPQGPPSPIILEAGSPCSFTEALQQAKDADTVFAVYEVSLASLQGKATGYVYDVTRDVLQDIAKESIERQRVLEGSQAAMCDAAGIEYYTDDMEREDRRDDILYRASVRSDYMNAVL